MIDKQVVRSQDFSPVFDNPFALIVPAHSIAIAANISTSLIAEIVGNQPFWKWSIYLWVMVAEIIGKLEKVIMILDISLSIGVLNGKPQLDERSGKYRRKNTVPI